MMPDPADRQERLEALFRSELFRRADHIVGDDSDRPAALPDASLEFLLAAADALGARRVFEFGSGRSTAAFLGHGLQVTSLEDDQRWMSDTVNGLDPALLAGGRHTARVAPLALTWWGGVPFRDWQLHEELAGAVAAADIVLIDSPFHAPFRISTLLGVLRLPTSALVVLDDTRIPTLSRAGDHLAQRNASRLRHARVNVGHGFDCFARRDLDVSRPLDLSFAPLEILKGWRRFFIKPRPL